MRTEVVLGQRWNEGRGGIWPEAEIGQSGIRAEVGLGQRWN